jgi:serine/threonine-protein phosphatase 2A regulatory subunit A
LTIELINDEDEVLLAYAQNLGKMIEHVGGQSKVLHLLKPLEELCSVEEGTVRTMAVKSVG